MICNVDSPEYAELESICHNAKLYEDDICPLCSVPVSNLSNDRPAAIYEAKKQLFNNELTCFNNLKVLLNALYYFIDTLDLVCACSPESYEHPYYDEEA
ncbi:MAG: hypothetical protein HRU38_10875 [Saccharospirillaceae bacterium]|nr:hypothetical protein [Saccharospirillaceae bacterium]